MYSELENQARKLGEAFQKVNFLRDLESDFEERGRSYFPHVNFAMFTTKDKLIIENEIKDDFKEALYGIAQLPLNARFGVYLAYKYYLGLLQKIRKTPALQLIKRRIRVTNFQKIMILIKSYLVFILKRGDIKPRANYANALKYPVLPHKAFAKYF